MRVGRASWRRETEPFIYMLLDVDLKLFRQDLGRLQMMIKVMMIMI